MLVSVMFLIAIAAFIATVLAAYNKCPLWVAVLFLCVGALLSAGIPLK